MHKHGTAMGPENACSYANLAMGLIDEKAKGSLKPLLWWRYRDDIFDLWTQGLPKLLEFTDCINSLYPTIKFELIYSDSLLHVLDFTFHLKDGLIVTDIYSKVTDLPFSSCSHPSHLKHVCGCFYFLKYHRFPRNPSFYTRPGTRRPHKPRDARRA